MGFDLKVSKFFGNYLVGQQTKYVWNKFSSYLFSVDMGVDQGLALSSILSVFYLSPILYIFKKQLKNLKISTSFLSFVDDSLFIA